MKQDDTKAMIILYLLGVIPVIWLGLIIAPMVSGGITEIISKFPIAINNPLNITFCENSVKTVLFFIVVYGMGIGIYISTKKNYRKREEHGSARWGSASSINKKYSQLPGSQNKILTQNVKIGLNGKKHRRNLNVMVVGRKSVQARRGFFANQI